MDLDTAEITSKRNEKEYLIDNFTPPVKKIKPTLSTTQSTKRDLEENDLKQLFVTHTQSSNINFEMLENFIDKICKKDVNEQHILDAYSTHIQEINDILENLRTVARSTVKYRITIALRKLKLISTKSEPPASIHDQSQVSTVEHVQLQSSD